MFSKEHVSYKCDFKYLSCCWVSLRISSRANTLTTGVCLQVQPIITVSISISIGLLPDNTHKTQHTSSLSLQYSLQGSTQGVDKITETLRLEGRREHSTYVCLCLWEVNGSSLCVSAVKHTVNVTNSFVQHIMKLSHIILSTSLWGLMSNRVFSHVDTELLKTEGQFSRNSTETANTWPTQGDLTPTPQPFLSSFLSWGGQQEVQRSREV